MEDLISIIIPIYNSERYLRDCMASVLAQTYSCFEMILIDDGSSDRSVKICQGMCRYDGRIRLICQKHRGVSAARNRGLEEAKGKYVFFIDSDDMIHPLLLETLYQLLEKTHAVMATEGYQHIKESSHLKKEKWDNAIEKKQKYYYLNNEEALRRLSLANREAMLYTIGGKMILRKALSKIRFHEKISHAEDTLFMYQLLNQGADVSVICCKWYGYRIHGSCATNLFSVKICHGKYSVEKHIRDQEIKNERIDNAICWESFIVEEVIKMYTVGRNNDDKRFARYAKRLAYTEKKSFLFKEIGLTKKIKYEVVFYCYPLYRLLCFFRKICNLKYGWNCGSRDNGRKFHILHE